MFTLIKFVSVSVVSVGVGNIVSNIVKATTPENVGKIRKFCITAGAMAISGIVGAKAVEYTENQVDTVAKYFNTNVEQPEENGEVKEEAQAFLFCLQHLERSLI